MERIPREYEREMRDYRRDERLDERRGYELDRKLERRPMFDLDADKGLGKYEDRRPYLPERVQGRYYDELERRGNERMPDRYMRRDEERIPDRYMRRDEERMPMGYEGERIEIIGLADEGDYGLMKRREKISEIRREIPGLREMPKLKEEPVLRREVIDRELMKGEVREKEYVMESKRSVKCGTDLNICYMNMSSDEVISKLMPDNSLVKLDKRMNFLSESGMHGAIYYSYLMLKDDDVLKKFKVALKFAKSKASDNLFYEFLVGLCVNKLRDMYPTFTRTLFVSRINDSEEFHKKIEMKKDFELEYSEMEQLRQNMPSSGDLVSMKNLGDFCSKGDNAGLMTEFIDNIGPIRNYLGNPSISFRQKIVNYVNILFQIYYTLYGVREIFVHNDLHRDNVILHKAKDGYGYAVLLPESGIKVRDEVIKFNKKQLVGSYMPVIIDYGRSFIDCEKLEKSKRNDLTTMNIARVMCKTPECKGLKSDRCGYGLGYNAISRGPGDEPIATEFEKGDLAYGFKMLKANQSQDLRYFLSSMEVFETLADYEIKKGTVLDDNEKFVVNFLIQSAENTNKSEKGYFMVDNPLSGVSSFILENLQYKEGFKINNILDLFIVLSFIINSNQYQSLL